MGRKMIKYRIFLYAQQKRKQIQKNIESSNTKKKKNAVVHTFILYLFTYKYFVYLVSLDPELDWEKVEMRELKAGLKKAASTLRPRVGPLWLRRRLIGACEEEKGVDQRRLDK